MTIELLASLLDSVPEPIVFADTEHVIRYMNAVARERYRKYGNLVGQSLLPCHNPQSQAIMHEVLAALQSGETERHIGSNATHHKYMRAVRSADGCLLGYYERFVPIEVGAVKV